MTSATKLTRAATEKKSFSLTQHARERLAQRSKLSEPDLLRLLDNKAFKRTFTKHAPIVSNAKIAELLNIWNLSYSELKSSGMLPQRAVYEHLLVWSSIDERPLTAISAVNSNLVVTILYADEYASHDWSDKITTKIIKSAQIKAEELRRNIENKKGKYEALVCWLEGEDRQLNRKLLKLQETNVSALDISALKRRALQVAGNGYEIQIIVRKENDHTNIALEIHLDGASS